MQDLAQDVLIQKIAHTTGVSGSGLALGSGVFGKLAENADAITSLGVIAGIIIGLAGFVVNWYYQRKRS